MDELFLKIVNMSVSASWLVIVVLALRLVLKKAPKWVNVLLWGIVAVRLICPFSIESALSLIPSSETISPEIMTSQTPRISTGVEAINRVVNPILAESFTPDPAASANPLQIWIPAASIVWLAGIAAMLVYTAITYGRLRRKVAAAVRLRENIFQSEHVVSPFVLGLFRPRIYLPYHMDEQEMAHVLAHEQTHIRRKDHWWKPLGFLLLTIHWFNPLMWLAYILLCRDIELACDERVIEELGVKERADYSQALLSCSANRRMIAACPLAFGEVGVKERVKNVLNYKKPGFWIVLIAVAVCVLVAVCFLTDPERISNLPEDQPMAISRFLYQNPEAETDFDVIGQCEYRVTGQMELLVLEAAKTEVWAKLGDLEEEHLSMLVFDDYFKNEDGWIDSPYGPEKFRKTYENAWRLDVNPNGAGLFYLLLELEDGSVYLMCGYDENVSTAENEPKSTMYWVAELSDGALEEGYVLQWVDYLNTGSYPYAVELEMELPEFPGVRFHYTSGQVTAENQIGKTILVSGMPVWNVFFSDLTKDGLPEICATVSYGSGLIDTHVVVCDYAEGQEYTLWDRGEYEYALRMENGTLICDKWEYPDGETVESGPLMIVHSVGGDGRRLMINVDAEKEALYYHAETAEQQYYLTVGSDRVASIEVSGPDSSGGCSHADGSLFAYGEEVYMEMLDGLTDLRGVMITALDEQGDVVFVLSVATGDGDPVNVVYAGEWTLAPKDTGTLTPVETIETVPAETGYALYEDLDLEEPPELTVTGWDGSLTAVTGTYSWSHDIGGGVMMEICSDSAHPLQMQGMLTPLITEGKTVELHFGILTEEHDEATYVEVPPQMISYVRAWPDDAWGNVNAQAQEPVVNGSTMELLQGGYIYEVRAKWTGEDGEGGAVYYAFYVFCADDSSPDPERPEMSFAGLEPDETMVDPELITVDDGGASLEYHLTYASPTIILEVGLVDEAGNEITWQAEDGSGYGTIEGIPEGKYHLFVRNAGCQGELPGKSVEAGAIVCQLHRN